MTGRCASHDQAGKIGANRPFVRPTSPYSRLDARLFRQGQWPFVTTRVAHRGKITDLDQRSLADIQSAAYAT